MKKAFALPVVASLAFALGLSVHFLSANSSPSKPSFPTNLASNTTMHLGAFSLSLSVKNLAVSKAFYEKLGFTVLGGKMEHKYLIMKNGNALVGLFEGMFQGNMLTFNPGWDESGKNTASFTDIRDIQAQLKAHQIPLTQEADASTKGPASFMLQDPDGNVILVDQHR